MAEFYIYMAYYLQDRGKHRGKLGSGLDTFLFVLVVDHAGNVDTFVGIIGFLFSYWFMICV